jgi:hypothetical protein
MTKRFRDIMDGNRYPISQKSTSSPNRGIIHPDPETEYYYEYE